MIRRTPTIVFFMTVDNSSVVGIFKSPSSFTMADFMDLAIDFLVFAHELQFVILCTIKKYNYNTKKVIDKTVKVS